MQVTKHQRSKEEHKEKQPKKTDYRASGVDESTLVSFLVHSQQRNKGFHREDDEG